MATKALSIHPSDQGVCGRHGAEEHVVTPGDLIGCSACNQPKNLRAAWNKVKANRGRGGIDGQGIEAFEQDCDEHLHRLHEDLRTDRYPPRPVKRVDIPKAGKPGE